MLSLMMDLKGNELVVPWFNIYLLFEINAV